MAASTPTAHLHCRQKIESVEEKVASLFQQDTLLPAQYFATYRRKAYLEPEKRFMLAVLQDAISLFQEHVLAQDAKRKTLFHEAESWIMDQGNDWLFSFDTICEVLGLNPRYVRQGLLRWKERKLTGRSKATDRCSR